MSLQNGRFAKSEIHVAKRRLHVQTRFNRYILFSSLGKKFEAICSLPLVRKLVRVPLPLLWFGWSFFRRDSHEPRHSNLPSATSRICHKLEKVCVDTSAGNIAFGPDKQLCHSTTFFKQNNSESSFRMSEFVKQSANINSGVDKVDWLVDVNYSSSFTSKVELSFPSNTTNIIFIGKPFLFRQSCFEPKLKNRTEMVGTKLRTVKWSGINSTACRGVNTGRCLNKGLGRQRAMESQRGNVVCSGNEKPYKCLRAFSHKTGYTNILENLEAQSHTSPGGQHGSFDISVKDEG